MKLFKFCFILFCLLIFSACAERTSFTITLKADGGNVNGAVITLTNIDNESPKVYQKTANGTVTLYKGIVTGTYQLTVEHEDYFPFEKEDIIVKNNDSGFIVDLFVNGPVFIQLIPNFGSARGAKVILGDLEGNQFVGVMDDHTATFKKIAAGEYNISITHDDFFDFSFGGFDAHSLVGNNEIKLYRKGIAGGYVFYDKSSYSNGWQYLETTHAGWEFVSTWDNAFPQIKKINQNGFTDWRLPSKDELNLMYQNLKVKGSEDPYATHVANFRETSYWTDTQRGTFYQYAWCQTFDIGNQWAGHQHISPRQELARVRAIRRF